MMDKRIQIWNLFHDAEITAISEDSEKLTMFVNIPYLRRRIKPLGDSFVVILSGLTRFEFQDLSGTAAPFDEELEMGSPEILSTESRAMPVKIGTTMGQLTLDFKSVRFALDRGQTINYASIQAEDGMILWVEPKRKHELIPLRCLPFSTCRCPALQFCCGTPGELFGDPT